MKSVFAFDKTATSVHNHGFILSNKYQNSLYKIPLQYNERRNEKYTAHRKRKRPMIKWAA
jgi:hypothetical protein